MWLGIYMNVDVLARTWQYPYLTVVFLDIGQGDAIFIRTPSGNTVLVDGGPSRVLLDQLSSYIPAHKEYIDLVVETHPDLDHIGGFAPLIERYSIGTYVRPHIDADTQIYARIRRLLDEYDIPVHKIYRGVRLHIDTDFGIYMDILHPGDDLDAITDRNEASLVKRLVYGSTSFMLTGDAVIANEMDIINETPYEYIQSTILKLGHHGSRTSTSREFLHAVQPEVGIVSAGAHNQYGHPHREVLDNLHFFNIPYRGTYREGDIVMYSDGIHIFSP